MAGGKYLDGGGLAHLWDKIKSYLATWIADWKTTNFGTGTYSNSNGELTIQENAKINIYSNCSIISSNNRFSVSSESDTSIRTRFEVGSTSSAGLVLPANKVVNYIDVKIGVTSQYGSSQIIINNMSGHSVKYLVITTKITTGTLEDGQMYEESYKGPYIAITY